MKNHELRTALFIALILSLTFSLSACSKKVTAQSELEKGEQYLKDGDYENAVASFTAAISLSKENKDAYLKRGQAYYQWAQSESSNSSDASSKYALAKDDFKKVLDMDSSNAEALKGVASIDNANEKAKTATPSASTEKATSSDSQSLFDETYWSMALGPTLGGQFAVLFHKDGTFSAIARGSVTHENGTYSYSGDLLTVKTVYGTQTYRHDGAGFTATTASEAQGLEFYASIVPDTEKDYASLDPQTNDGTFQNNSGMRTTLDYVALSQKDSTQLFNYCDNYKSIPYDDGWSGYQINEHMKLGILGDAHIGECSASLDIEPSHFFSDISNPTYTDFCKYCGFKATTTDTGSSVTKGKPGGEAIWEDHDLPFRIDLFYTGTLDSWSIDSVSIIWTC